MTQAATKRPSSAQRSGGRRSTRSAAPGPFSIIGLLDDQGAIKVDAAAEVFSMSRAQLADTAGLAREALQKASRRDGPKAQTRVREVLEIINLVQGWAGGPAQAMAWYRAEPIPAFGGRTAEALVKSGNATVVRDYLDHLATGGYA